MSLSNPIDNGSTLPNSSFDILERRLCTSSKLEPGPVDDIKNMATKLKEDIKFEGFEDQKREDKPSLMSVKQDVGLDIKSTNVLRYSNLPNKGSKLLDGETLDAKVAQVKEYSYMPKAEFASMSTGTNALKSTLVEDENLNLKSNHAEMLNSQLTSDAVNDPSHADEGILELQCPPSPRYETIQELDIRDARSQTEHGSSESMDVDLVSNSQTTHPSIPSEDRGSPAITSARLGTPTLNTTPTPRSSRHGVQGSPAASTQALHDTSPLRSPSVSDYNRVLTRRQRKLMNAAVVPDPSPSPLKARDHFEKVPATKAEPVEILPSVVKLEPLTEDDIAKLNILRNNPDVKIKKEDRLDDLGVVARLRALGPDGLDEFPITLDDNIKMARVTRRWMSHRYGGSPQGGRVSVNIKKFTHGIKHFNYMTYGYNPDAPRRPGAPGIMFGCYGDNPDSFHKEPILIRSTHEALWLYMGFYECTPSTPLTAEEWRARPAKFHDHWAEKISKKGWGASLRVRIGLRHDLGREPTEQEVARAVAKKKYENLSPDQIKEAFDSGQENLLAWCMKCVKYDKAFQRRLSTMPGGYRRQGKKQEVTEEKEVVEDAKNTRSNRKRKSSSHAEKDLMSNNKRRRVAA